MPATKPTTMKLTPLDHVMIGAICQRQGLTKMAEAIRFALYVGSAVPPKTEPKIPKKSRKTG